MIGSAARVWFDEVPAGVGGQRCRADVAAGAGPEDGADHTVVCVAACLVEGIMVQVAGLVMPCQYCRAQDHKGSQKHNSNNFHSYFNSGQTRYQARLSTMIKWRKC